VYEQNNFYFVLKSNKTNIIIYADPGRSMMPIKYFNIIMDLVLKNSQGGSNGI